MGRHNDWKVDKVFRAAPGRALPVSVFPDTKIVFLYCAISAVRAMRFVLPGSLGPLSSFVFSSAVFTVKCYLAYFETKCLHPRVAVCPCIRVHMILHFRFDLLLSPRQASHLVDARV